MNVFLSVEISVAGIEFSEELKERISEVEADEFDATGLDYSEIYDSIMEFVPEENHEVTELSLSVAAVIDTDFNTSGDFIELSLDTLKELAEAEEEFGKAFVVYYENGGDSDTSNFQEAYAGEYDSGGEFAQQICEEVEDLRNVPGYISSCINWDDVWESGLQYDYWEEQDFYFRNI